MMFLRGVVFGAHACRFFYGWASRVGKSVALIWCCSVGFRLSAQWTLTAIHPDPTPFLGAPMAEFIAVMASASADSCVSSSGWSLSWNGNERFLPEGCWDPGTVLVAHRASDSAAFAFGPEVSIPFASWPALVNSGSTVFIVNPSGKIDDAMSYTDQGLGGGGRPVLRMDTAACGGPSNQQLWEPGLPVFLHLTEPQGPNQDATVRALKRAREPGRLVPRGGGALDWFLGSDFDPARTVGARAWLDGQEVDLIWASDSVVSMSWNSRAAAWPGADSVKVMVGPLRSCPAGSRNRMFTSGFQRLPTAGAVEFTGVWPDPAPGDPHHPTESFALENVSEWPIDVGGWWFGAAQLKRHNVLAPGASRVFEAEEFDGWKPMSNEGGVLELRSHWGGYLSEAAWSPCDHDFPAYAGTGLGLVRSALKGADWSTEGSTFTADDEAEPALTGFGCIADFNGQPTGLDVHLTRYVGQLPEQVWSVLDREVTGFAASRISGQPKSWRLSWAGMQDDITWPSSSTVCLEIEGLGFQKEWRMQCPSLQPEVPCLKISEMMWDAAEDGDEFVEIVNCGSQPVELAGLQATVKADPFPSDWRYWRLPGESLVLVPGEVAAFGRCPKWMGNGLPNRGSARWSAAEWSSLADSEGQLALRIPMTGGRTLDSVQWDSGLEGPWWWSSDGWAWSRSGPGSRDWVPSPDRGSPGETSVRPLVENCAEAVLLKEPENGGLPGLNWSFPEAGGTIEIRMVQWPSGNLARRVVLEDLDIEGNWSGWLPPESSDWGGQALLVVRWWTPSCSGRRTIRLHDFTAG